MEGSGHRHVLEIEGLRAVAAVLVAVYHVFLGRVSGGVDVFFVIAGFLITTSLLGQATGGDRVRIGRYLGRLAVRLLPIAVVVLLFAVVGTVLWMPDTRRASMLGEITASALYVENWALAQKAVDYAAQGELKSPVQHFWAMSVQGQFYLLWLGLVGVVALVARPARARQAMGLVLSLVLAMSLAFSAWLTAANQPLAYFHTGTRVWEFAAGGLLAVVLEPVIRALGRLGRGGTVVRGISGWAGLGLVVSCGLVLQVSAAFPGVAALWPVTGAILVVIAAGGGGSWSVSRLLASGPLVFLGGVAYALYLWHWPMLVFARLGSPTGTIDLPTGLVVLAASLALAILTTHLVERPIRLRFSSVRRPWLAASAGAASLTAVVLVAGLAGHPGLAQAEATPDPSLTALLTALDEDPPAEPGKAAPDDDGGDALEIGGLGAGALDAGSPGATHAPEASPLPAEGGRSPGMSPDLPDSASPTPAASPAGLTVGRSEGPFVPTLAAAAEDETGLYRQGCQQNTATPDLIICVRGDSRGRTSVMLIGGSHATHWYPALNTIAKRRDWRLLTAVKGNCRFSMRAELVHGDPEDPSCKAWLDELLAWIRANQPDVVITTGTITLADREYLPAGYLEIWRMLDKRGIPVVAIRDTPRAGFNRVDCLARHRKELWKCDIPRSPTLDAVNPLLKRDDIPDNVIVVDVSDWICTADTCPAIVGHVVVYADAHHLTAAYVKTLIPMLAAQIPEDPVAAIAED